jgi:hypothetical protein
MANERDIPPADPNPTRFFSPEARAAFSAHAPHVQATIRRSLESRPAQQNQPISASHFVAYAETRLGNAPPPMARKPLYVLLVGPRGEGCKLQDLNTGRVRPAQTVFAGYVRMAENGPIFLSPRTMVGVLGDSHPTIAAQTPEWARGQRSIVAGGEIGIIDGRIVGHNDRTGHFRSRRNRDQSGLPADRFYPFGINPRTWFK